LEERLSAWLLPLFIGAAILITAAAFILTYGLGIGPTMGPGMSTLMVVIMLAIGLTNILHTRFYAMPKQLEASKRDERYGLESARTLGCAFALAPAIYGLVTAVFTGHGLIALPFLAISLIGFYAVWSFLQEHPVPPEPPGGGWRYRERGR
jgi:hypothetical protein